MNATTILMNMVLSTIIRKLCGKERKLFKYVSSQRYKTDIETLTEEAAEKRHAALAQRIEALGEMAGPGWGPSRRSRRPGRPDLPRFCRKPRRTVGHFVP